MSDKNKNYSSYDDVEIPEELLEELHACIEEYQNTEIPEELSAVVCDAVEESKERGRFTLGRAIKYTVNTAAAVLLFFGILLNVSPTVAQAACEIPGFGDFCRFLIVRDYEFQDELKYIDAEIPAIADSGNSELEERVNLEIRKIMDQELADSEARAQEYYDAFVQTGGNPEEFVPLGITVDYEIKMMTEKYVSFIVSKYETRSSAYYTRLFYNIDMESGRILTLKDCLGNDYKQIAAQSIENTISGWSEEQKALLWDDNDFEKLITENTDFYIDENESVVVVFSKYEVAVGAAGTLEFAVAQLP